MMRRRTFLAGSVGLLAAPLAVEAQSPGKVRRLVIVAASTPVTDMVEGRDPNFTVLFAELRRLGYVEGQGLVVERRSAEGRPERHVELAREVVSLNPELVFSASSRVTRALKTTTRTIPVVGLATDPLGSGLVPSLARPGGNVTGFSLDAGDEIQGKRLALLKEAVPSVSRVVVLAPRGTWEGAYGNLVRQAARQVRVTLLSAPLDQPIGEPEYRRAFAGLPRGSDRALFVSEHAENWVHRGLIVALAGDMRLPAVYPFPGFGKLGGLLAYGVDQTDLYRRAADYIDRILKGTSPGILPFQQPTKFDLVVNVGTAKALGLTIPPSVLARADEILQ